MSFATKVHLAEAQSTLKKLKSLKFQFGTFQKDRAIF